MAKVMLRSPRYPIIGLREALEKAQAVYKADNRNKIPKHLVAGHMGYSGLNGASLGIISAVTKYGLLEGGRDAMWITPRAVDIFEREPNDPDRAAALVAAADEPELFRALKEAFPEKASDAALRSFLITKREFLPQSAERLVRAYRETRELVDAECGSYSSPSQEDYAVQTAHAPSPRPATAPPPPMPPVGDAPPRAGERELVTGMLSKGSSFRLVVSGAVGVKEIERLIRKLELDKEILADTGEDDDLNALLG